MRWGEPRGELSEALPVRSGFAPPPGETEFLPAAVCGIPDRTMSEPSKKSAADRVEMHEQNRRSWNAITPVHNSHKKDQAAFLRGGGSTLFPEERDLLGDASGKRVVHLQCNCGQDTLSIAALGADVLGVDISDEAVAFATELSEDSGVPARFERSDLFDWFDSTEETFDIAFTTYGGIGWLCDIDAWARGVARVLVPGGRLVFLEFHPLVWSFGADGKLRDSYFIAGPLRESEGVQDYVAEPLAPSGFAEGVSSFTNPEPNVSFQWTAAQTVQALIDAGMRLEIMREYPFANGCAVIDGLRQLPGRRFTMPEGQPSMPLMLGLRAVR